MLARRYFYPGCHRMAPYNSLFPNAHLALPQTERVAARVLTLPTGESVSPDMIRAVCDLIRVAFDNSDELRRLMEEKSADPRFGVPVVLPNAL